MKSDRLLNMDWLDGTMRVIGDDEDEHVVVLVTNQSNVLVIGGEVNGVKF